MIELEKCPVNVTTSDWLKYLRLRAQVMKLKGKWEAASGRRTELLFDVALIAGSKVYASGAELMEYYTTVAKPRAERLQEAYTRVVAEVIKQKAEEAIELDAKVSAALAKYLAKVEAFDALKQKIEIKED